ncbi:Dihydroorotate dehydrogenase, electron transfer subunit, iron-sulfur cluster binding domain-containing protein [Spirochaeta thermophila DSM 6578]|uniref:Dihydroorotate dehydrogenase, electron transfer subunit, iron-sulfur cluster binding domain-containing protein n=1 Tax=Winmispira thermophila (strain ATCC 700085 / DSM 6578 / Z-1203) TaxID=869211 RepID=G0GF24_WINT7|nr:dihydroorotate dehydrogenase electron transfer subunit [Spirochaeta thermophila]AEJ62368.1 Dihydroorotate dehydrogenase, electron transfer subunit, iron-sulfur cluster binding domain-containing protein [Spirochaeta thermophila DSM 6578]
MNHDLHVAYTSVEILEQREIARCYYLLEFSYPPTAPEPRPGQFFTMRIGNGPVPLLRRPFAFSSYRNGRAACIYQRRGRATTMLTTHRAGDVVDIIGPLGRPFPLKPSYSRPPVLVSGGIGIGPILFLSRTLEKQGIDHLLVLGARNADLLPSHQPSRPTELVLCTDDGSTGFSGTTVDYLSSRGGLGPEVVLYACGPTPMLKGLARLVEATGAELWVSLEQTMACGVGACLSCVVPTTGSTRYARVCTEGPVFNAKEIAWTSL